MKLSLLSVLVSLLLGVATVQGANTNPLPGQPAQAICQLSTIDFSNNVQFDPLQPFSPTRFDYVIRCPAVPLTTIVTPRTNDTGSYAEVKFNGVYYNSKAQGNAISNFQNVYKAYESHSQPLTFQQGINTIVVGVSCSGRGNPPCYYEYSFTCSCGTSVIGDPQFVGLRGQSYQVHGVSGEIYNIVSDPAFQLNAKFVFLDHGKCPVINGKKQKGCFAHAGSYLGEIGLKTRAGDKVKLVSGPAEKGFAGVEINGKAMEIGDSVVLADDMGSISFNSTHLATVQIGNWLIEYENSDMYVNQQVSVSDAHSLRSHGLLGQTWRQTTYPKNPIKYIQGHVDDYVIRNKDIFGDNFVYNMFN